MWRSDWNGEGWIDLLDLLLVGLERMSLFCSNTPQQSPQNLQRRKSILKSLLFVMSNSFCSRNLLGIDADSVKSPLSVSSELGFSDLGLRLLFLTFDLTAVFLEIFSWTAQLPSLRRQRSSGFTFLVTLSSFFVFVVTTWNYCHRLKFIQHSTIWKQTKHTTQFSRELSWLGVTYWLSSTVFPRLC